MGVSSVVITPGSLLRQGLHRPKEYFGNSPSPCLTRPRDKEETDDDGEKLSLLAAAYSGSAARRGRHRWGRAARGVHAPLRPQECAWLTWTWRPKTRRKPSQSAFRCVAACSGDLTLSSTTRERHLLAVGHPIDQAHPAARRRGARTGPRPLPHPHTEAPPSRVHPHTHTQTHTQHTQQRRRPGPPSSEPQQ